MSKKKAFAGSTMTLKDFHGGSIPSDLPLPSAPGVIVRSSEWSTGGFDRPNFWGGSVGGGRGDHHRLRPSSSPATRHLDDKTPFLNHVTHIGRHFDEDERKPLDGVSAPRRTVSDDNFRGSGGLNRVELKPEPVSSKRVMGPQVSSSYLGKVSDHVGVGSQSVGSNSGQSAGSNTNPWTHRKELAVGVNDPAQPAWSGANAVSKLAHASALEKVSSGRWQTKQSIQYQADVESVDHLQAEKVTGSLGHDSYAYDRTGSAGGREYSDTNLARNVERSLSIEDVFQSGRKEYLQHERTMGAYSEFKDRSLSAHNDRVLSQRSDSRFGGSELQPSGQSEPSERPKVKLLPRTKPFENFEAPMDHKQEYQYPSNSADGFVEKGELHGRVNAGKPSLDADSANQVIERPKLNLKQRSQPLEQSEEAREKERASLFGGARPREMVLKERGGDDAPVSNHDVGQHGDSSRFKHDAPKIEKVSEHAAPSRRGEKTDNMPVDQRNRKKFERKDQRVEAERTDKQRGNWRNENWRNGRESERQHQPQLQQERPPSPETWRKLDEQAKPASPNAAGLRFGKTASALELAQAFSKSLSDPKPADRYSGQRNLPGKTHVPFSRLTGPTSRPQINGF